MSNYRSQHDELAAGVKCIKIYQAFFFNQVAVEVKLIEVYQFFLLNKENSAAEVERRKIYHSFFLNCKG